jgi:hypothetical protein
MLKLIILSLVLTLTLQQVPTTCPANCADCRNVQGVVSCYACYNSAFNQQQTACSGVAAPNCMIMGPNGCTTCNVGFAFDPATGNCVNGTIANCVLEYVDTPSNKCVSCNGSYPTDDLTACGNNPILPTDDCLWGTVMGQCIRCKYGNQMAAGAGECVGRYLYGCLQENSVGRCNGCDYQNGFYMKFDTMCWKDAPTTASD